jgi:hypothetical protein
MSTVTGFGISPFANRSSLQAPDAGRAIAQSLDASDGASATGATASPASAATAPLSSYLKIVTNGITPAPKLSANVIEALLQDRALQSTQGTTSTGAASQTTALSGASAESAQAAASSDSSSSDSSSSTPPTLQDIAKQFDLHNLTNTLFESLARQLGAAGAISGSALIDIATKLGGLGVSPALEGKPSSDKIVSIWDGVTDNTPPYDVVNKVKGWLTADTQAGYPQAQTEQQILNVLDQLDSIRNGAQISVPSVARGFDLNGVVDRPLLPRSFYLRFWSTNEPNTV